MTISAEFGEKKNEKSYKIRNKNKIQKIFWP